jgi:integrase
LSDAPFSNQPSELSPDYLLFPNDEAKLPDPSAVSHNSGKLAQIAGLQGIRSHDLRYIFPNLMLLRGVLAKAISEALGYTSAAFTMDTYSHIMAGMQSDAIVSLGQVLPAGRNEALSGIYANS